MDLNKLLIFFDKLRAGLLEGNFVQSQIDRCLFMKRNMICLVYVDDKILCGPNLDEINKGKDHVHRFQLKDEGQVGDYLGIRIEKLGQGTFNLTQSDLTKKVLAAAIHIYS